MNVRLGRQDVPNTHQLDDLRRITISYITRRNLPLMETIILQKLHVTRYFNTTICLVVVSIGVRVFRITNKNTLDSSRFEFTELFIFVLDEALATKDTEVLDVGLLTCENLIWSHVKGSTEEEPVRVVDRGSNSFSPKIVRGLEFTQHCSCHINDCPVLPFNNTILLRGIRS